VVSERERIERLEAEVGWRERLLALEERLARLERSETPEAEAERKAREAARAPRHKGDFPDLQAKGVYMRERPDEYRALPDAPRPDARSNRV
jgi:hypothetical protein